MADNYLEKKMEEHRANQGAMPKRKLTPTGAKPGKLIVDFPPRRVYVTGGAKGIGRAIVKAFCDAGCKVAFCDCDEKAGRDTAQTCGAQFHPLDVSNHEALAKSVERTIEGWGGLDVIVNNVGVGLFKPFAESTLDEFKHVLDINLMPVWITAHGLAKSREGKEKAYGRIINISSTRHLMSEPGTEPYSASKGAIASLTHALMASLAPMGITVNCISPGWIENGDYSALRPDEHDFHPSGRVGIASDIAKMCIYLASPAAEFINGQDIVIDGGVTKKMIYPPD